MTLIQFIEEVAIAITLIIVTLPIICTIFLVAVWRPVIGMVNYLFKTKFFVDEIPKL